jgi:hypothetical protein
MGNKQMNNPEKRATLGTQDTVRRQTKQNTHQYTQANNVNKTWAPLQTTACFKTNGTSFSCGNRNTELRT